MAWITYGIHSLLKLSNLLHCPKVPVLPVVVALMCTFADAAAAGSPLDVCSGGCSGHGVCSGGGCICLRGWAGRNCGVMLSQRKFGDPQADPLSALEEHRALRHVQTGLASFACVGGCSGVGECVAGVCVCNSGFYGPTCAKQIGSQLHAMAALPTATPMTVSSGSDALHPGVGNVAPTVAAHFPALKSAELFAAKHLRGRVGDTQPPPPDTRISWPRLPVPQPQHLSLLHEAAPQPGFLASSSGQPRPRQATPGTDWLAEFAQKLDAARRVQRAVASARSRAAELPGHAFRKQEDIEGRNPSSIVSLRQGAESRATSGVSKVATPQSVSVCGAFLCGAHGACNMTLKACECDEGWVGQFCDTPACEDDCSGNGLCVDASCICDPKFFGTSCQHTRCPADCSGHGYCFSGRCECTAGYGGDACDELVHSTSMVHLKLPEKQAKAKGEPSASASTVRAAPASSSAACAANCSGHGLCDQSGICHCDMHWFGTSCADYCPDGCSNHGQCLKGACLCDNGWFGNNCGTRGECSAHGAVSSRTGACECDPGWTGSACEMQVVCPDLSCSGRGVCQNTGTCLCGAGYSGLACEIVASSCEGTCGEHGRCNLATSTCDCAAGWSGPRCTVSLAACPSACNGHGTCIDGFCVCDPGFEGDACDGASSLASRFAQLECVNASLGCATATALAQSRDTEGDTHGPGQGAVGETVHVKKKAGAQASGPSTASWLPRLPVLAVVPRSVGLPASTVETPAVAMPAAPASAMQLEDTYSHQVALDALRSSGFSEAQVPALSPPSAAADSVAQDRALAKTPETPGTQPTRPSIGLTELAALMEQMVAAGVTREASKNEPSSIDALSRSGFQMAAQKPMQQPDEKIRK